MQALKLLAPVVFVSLPLHAASLDDLTYTKTDGEVTITGLKSFATGELVIPATIEGIPVTSIGEYAFMGEKLKIDTGDFKRVHRLTSITIPDSVTSIGKGAFFSCSLTSITIPDGVTSIGKSAFTRCISLKSIIIPDSVTSIGGGAFAECGSLTSITIGKGVTSLGSNIFDSVRSFIEPPRNIIFKGDAPVVGFENGIAKGTAYVLPQFADSFGGLGSTWEGLTVEILKPPTITACGLTTPQTFFIEFEPAGEGYRVMSSPTLDFGNAVEIRPTLQPTSGSDNRFEFTASGSRNFYRLELTE